MYIIMICKGNFPDANCSLTPHYGGPIRRAVKAQRIFGALLSWPLMIPTFRRPIRVIACITRRNSVLKAYAIYVYKYKIIHHSILYRQHHNWNCRTLILSGTLVHACKEHFAALHIKCILQ